MEIFRNPNYNFLAWKWPLIGLSLVLSVAGNISLLMKGGPRYGIDFRGGTMVYVKFKDQPQLDKLRTELQARGLGESTTQRYGPESNHEIIIGVEQKHQEDQAIDTAKAAIIEVLRAEFNVDAARLDLNNAGRDAVADRFVTAGGLGQDEAQAAADALMAYRNEHGGLVGSVDAVRNLAGVTPAAVKSLEKDFALAPFTVRNVELVGPKVGADLRRQALNATLYALAGMLIYIAFRFEWVYGVAAVVATFHDVIITLGFFSLFNYEISLPVVAALLTLVGYSMNDTIVVFDRMRENVKLLGRKESLGAIANMSINQTLSRTVLTSGLTFVTVLCLFFFGGEVLRGFSFALVVGILIGTYSSIAIAAPIVVIWQQWWQSRQGKGAVITLEKEKPRDRPARVRARAKV
jgi:preprotein translocase subunit SecF